ncbi:MAG: hypothetical protein ACK516_07290, partial [Cyanobium sp.]
RPAGAQPSGVECGPGHGQTGRNRTLQAMKDQLRTWLSMALFVVMAGYVSFSAIRLGWLLWLRFAGS